MNENEMEEILNAKKQVVDGNLILWRTRIATIAQVRGSAAALDLIQSPVEPAENTFNQNFGSGSCCQPPKPPPATLEMGDAKPIKPAND